jgi:hypothetical protein
MSVALSVVFTGLCALVTNGDRAPAELLLVDAQGVGPVNGVLLPEHAPTLAVSLRSLANAETSHPTRVIAGSLDRGTSAEQIGIWDLTGSEVRIRVANAQEPGLQLFRPHDGSSSWPEPPRDRDDAASWRDLRFVADMKGLAGDGRIDPSLVGSEDPATVLPRAVAARIHLEGGRIEAGIPSQEAYRSDMFDFSEPGALPRLRQAVTDTIRWSLESNAAAVVIEITPVAGGAPRRLVFAPSDEPRALFVSNLPAQNVHPAHAAISSEEMGALHFGAYYELLRVKPKTRPLPRIAIGPEDRRVTGIMGRPNCPPAWFHED